MDYTLSTENDQKSLASVTAMDLLKTAQPNSELGSKAKLGALVCFAVACALLAVSLIMPETAQVGGDYRATTTGSVVQGH